MRMLNEQEENDVEVTWEDQQRINSFSRFNTRLADVEEDLRLKKEEREALDDLSMEIELVDEEETVLYKVGDAFISVPQARALELLERDTAALDAEIERLKGNADQCEVGMKDLKVSLYAKFGQNINLERD